MSSERGSALLACASEELPRLSLRGFAAGPHGVPSTTRTLNATFGRLLVEGLGLAEPFGLSVDVQDSLGLLPSPVVPFALYTSGDGSPVGEWTPAGDSRRSFLERD